jgi:hypothetical protein
MSERRNDIVTATTPDEVEVSPFDIMNNLSNTQREELQYHLSWGATPLAGSEYPEVMHTQNEVVRPLLLHRVETGAPEGMPEPLRQFMEESFLTRFIGRAVKNYDAYSERLVKTPPSEIGTGFAEQHELAIRGLAQPERLLVVRRTLGMKAVELARLTHSYGEKIEELDPMRKVVAEAIKAQGGNMYSVANYKEQYKLRSTDLLMNPERKDEAMGLLMTRRRMIGMVDDDTAILERSSFVVPIYDGSPFNSTLSARMRRVPLLENPDRMKQLETEGRLLEVVPGLLNDNNYEAAIPLSTTIFAYNKVTDQEIKERARCNKSHEGLMRIRQMTLAEPNYKPKDMKTMTENYNNESLDL